MAAGRAPWLSEQDAVLVGRVFNTAADHENAVVGAARDREARDGQDTGAPAPTTVPDLEVVPVTPRAGTTSRALEIAPGVWMLNPDPRSMCAGPSSPTDYLAGLVTHAARQDAPIRVQAPDMPLLHRITLAAADQGLVAVFSLHPDGDRATVTVHPS